MLPKDLPEKLEKIFRNLLRETVTSGINEPNGDK